MWIKVLSIYQFIILLFLRTLILAKAIGFLYYKLHKFFICRLVLAYESKGQCSNLSEVETR